MRAHMQWLIMGLVAFAGFVIISVSLSLTLAPLAGVRSYPILPTEATTTATTTAPNTTVPATTTTTAPHTTTAANTTTPVAYRPIAVGCPPDITIALGSSLDPAHTGQANYTASVGASCGQPVVTYVDSGQLNGAFKRSPQGFSAYPVETNPADLSQGTPVYGFRSSPAAMAPIPIALSGGQWGRRSATFAQNNIDPQYGSYLDISGLGVARPDVNGASSATQTITAVNSDTGSMYHVTDTAFVTVWLVFSAASSFGTGACASNASAWGESTVTWDNDAERWLILERSASGSVLCLYLSSTNDALDPWLPYQYSMPVGSPPSYAQLGVWPQAYVIATNVTGGVLNLCVLDRLALLAEEVQPALFCGTSLSGPLAGFTQLQSWTPLSVEGDAAMPDADIESAGTASIGAVWMRQHDNELHDSSATPSADWIDVEHWTNINFTLSTYIPLRYVITVADFDSSFAACESEVACIPSPLGGNLTQLDPVRQVIMRRLVYRDGSAWGSFVSNANGVDTAHVRWFQLSWQAATQTQAARWALRQEGDTLSAGADNVNRWLSSIAVDSQGTAVLGYSAGNASIAVQMMAASRLANDPLNGLRNEELVALGVAQTMNGTQWGAFQSVSSVPGAPRTFLFHGQTQLEAIQTYAFVLRIRGETLLRTWSAADLCSVASCNQTIVEE